MVVEPIKDKKKLNAFMNYLKVNNERNWMLAKFQLNVGLRISDIVPIKVSDVMNSKMQFRKYFALNEKKTTKSKKITFNENFKKDVQKYISDNSLEYDDYLFPSRKKKDGEKYHITTVQAYRALKLAADEVGIEHFGTHSLRKTFGYNMYINTGHNIALIQQLFNHDSQKDTMRYIGLDQEEKDKAYMTFYI